MDFECQFQCEIRAYGASPALTIRLTTRASDIARLFDEGYASIMRYLDSLGKAAVGPPFAVYYTMDMERLDVEFGFPVEEGIEGNDSITASSTPSGKAATCLYIGPYEEVEPAYDALMQWIDENDFESTGVAYEIYLNDPGSTLPDFLKTQVSLFLKS